MKENKLADLSMDFSVQIINLVKDLRARHESVISNQIGRSGTSIGAKYSKQTMRKAKRISSQNLRSRSRKRAKPGIGWSCFIAQDT